MAYVPVPKDLTKVKTKFLFNLTKRQVVCFGLGALVGVPLFFLTKDAIGSSMAVLVIIMAAHKAARMAIHKAAPHCKVGLTMSLFDYQPTTADKEMADRLWQEDFGWYLPYIQDDNFLGVQNYTRKIVDLNGACEPEPNARLTQMGYEDYPASIGHVLRKVAE